MFLKSHYGFWRQVRWRSRAARANADAQLRSSEQACTVTDAAVARIDIAHLPANRPTEDYYAAAKCLSTEAFLFGVFDGHGGDACSRFISTHLFDYISASALKRHLVNNLPLRKSLQWYLTNGDLFDEVYREKHFENVEHFHKEALEDQTMTTVRKALEASFCACDKDLLVNAASGYDEFSKQYGSIVTTGSCALIAHLRGADLHVANVGDSAAILGVLSQGVISAMPLSKSHSVDNDDEVRRLRASHPSTEANNMIIGGRLFGELFPLRAFGDVRYKWPVEQQIRIFGNVSDCVPRGLHTPPYLTALPEVLYHRLSPNDRFLVLATDGLWDCLEPEIVVKLVFDHALGAQTLASYKPVPGTALSEVYEELRQRQSGKSKKPLDDNSATHLLRYALGGPGGVSSQYLRLIEMLQLPPSVARRYRDDITIIVIHFDQNYFDRTTGHQKV